MNYCKVCGKKLELTPEYDMCIECQGKQHRTFTLPYNGGVNTNHTEMTAKEALETLTKQLNLAMNGSKVDVEIANKSRNIITQSLTELEAIKSADGGEAMEQLEIIREYYDEDGEEEQTCDSWNIVKNFILKSQAQERELAELKATQLTFSQDNEFVHIEGYGVYEKCDIEQPKNCFKIKIGSDKDE